jgi:uncharacterized protein YggT (Ycf19 family)
MNLVDFLLNLAALLLWLNWRSFKFRFGPRVGMTGYSALLQQTGPPAFRRTGVLCGLVALLALRTWFYWKVGSGVRWVPSLDLGVVTLPFKSISLGRMALYSAGSFALVWVVFYLWLLLLSMVNRSQPETDVWQKLVRLHLGWVEGWPLAVKLLAPWLLAACGWYLAHPGLAALGMVLPPKSTVHLWQQGLVIGLGTFIAWKYLIGLALLLHIVNSYLYLGNYQFWTFIGTTARHLLAPLRWAPLRWGQIDFTPVVGIALVFLVAQWAERGLSGLLARLPL